MTGLFRDEPLKLAALIFLCVSAAIASLLLFTAPILAAQLSPQLEAKARMIAAVANITFDRAQELGMSLEELPGKNDLLARLADEDVVRIDLRNLEYKELASYARASAGGSATDTVVTVPVAAFSQQGAELVITMDSARMDRLTSGLWIALCMIIVAALILSAELAYFLGDRLIVDWQRLRHQAHLALRGRFVTRDVERTQFLALDLSEFLHGLSLELNARYAQVMTTLKERVARRHFVGKSPIRTVISLLRQLRTEISFERRLAPREEGGALGISLGGMRMSLFLCLLAEDMTRPLLPVFAGEATQVVLAVPSSMAGALSISMFMLAVVLSQVGFTSWWPRAAIRSLYLF